VARARAHLVGGDDALEGVPDHQEPGGRLQLPLLPPLPGGRGKAPPGHALAGVVQLGVALPLGQIIVKIRQPEIRA
jgi:hypothetical protein